MAQLMAAQRIGMNDDQRKMFFALLGKQKKEVKDNYKGFLQERYTKDSTKLLTENEITDVLEYLETNQNVDISEIGDSGETFTEENVSSSQLSLLLAGEDNTSSDIQPEESERETMSTGTLEAQKPIGEFELNPEQETLETLEQAVKQDAAISYFERQINTIAQKGDHLKELLKIKLEYSAATRELLSYLEESRNLRQQKNEILLAIRKNEAEWQLKLSQMDKEEIKEFGSNADIRNAKIKATMAAEYEQLETKDYQLNELSGQIELLKLKLSDLRMSKEILVTFFEVLG